MTYSEFLQEWNKPDGEYKDIKEGGFPVLKERLGMVAVAFEREYRIHLTTVKKWTAKLGTKDYREPSEWCLPMMTYCFLVVDRPNKAKKK